MTCTKFFRTHLASPASFNVVHSNATIMLLVTTHSASPRALCSPRALLWHSRNYQNKLNLLKQQFCFCSEMETEFISVVANIIL